MRQALAALFEFVATCAVALLLVGGVTVGC